MNDEQLRAAYEQGLPRGHDRLPLDDTSAERLRRLVEREGSEEDRLHTLDAVLSTAAGRLDLNIVVAAARAARPRPRRTAAWLAVASVLLLAGATGTWWMRRTDDNVLRDDASPITLLSPIGVSQKPARFVWHALRGAERYTLVVVDSAGNEMFAADTRDTAVALPDSVRLAAGQQYLWWVQARTGTGASVTAITQRVTIAPPR